MSGALNALIASSAATEFAPFSDLFTVAGSGNVNVPTGCNQLTIELYGAGGEGFMNQSDWGGGAGGGAYVKHVISIDPSDWGKSLSYVVGNGPGRRHWSVGPGGGTDGGDSTVDDFGVLSAPSVSLVAGGGRGGDSTDGGNGGSASGGNDTNTNGSAGDNSDTVATSGGGAAGPLGTGTGNNGDGDTPGGGGGGGKVDAMDSTGAGADGRVEFSWELV